MFGPVQLAGDPGDVMVADEGQRGESLEEFIVALHGPVQLVEIGVIEAAPDRLPQLVLGHRVGAGALDECAVIAVNHLRDEPSVRVGLAHPRQHLRPKSFGHRVGGVQSPAVGTAAEPVVHDVDRVIHDRRVAMVEGNQIAVALEVLEIPGPAREP